MCMCVILNDIDTGEIACILHRVVYALKYNYIIKQFSINNIPMSVREIMMFYILLNRLTDHKRELRQYIEWVDEDKSNEL